MRIKRESQCLKLSIYIISMADVFFFFNFFNFQHLNLFWNSSSTVDEIISYEVKTSGGWEENNKPKRIREDKVIRTGEEISH